ncbi:MAG: FecR domain-containing protein [Saprospiraceae bacterium]|nr:FecR domain-containing protein [Saprospiraceae bacterium]
MGNKDLHEFKNNLLEDDSFISWVKSEFVIDDVQWSAFVDDHLDKMDSINECIKLVRNIDFAEHHSLDTEALWTRISDSTAYDVSQEKGKVKQLFSLNWAIAVLAAACIAMIIIFKPGMSDSHNVSTGIAEEFVQTLPDGSKVKLNAETSISFNEHNWNKERIVHMKGLAFFEVKKGSKFSVQSDKGIVEVLGTSFSVNSRDNTFEVICKTGKVEVTSAGSESSVTLLPGDKSLLKNGLLEIKDGHDNTPNQITWLEGIYTFEDVELQHVLKELERQFNVTTFVSDEFKGIKYTGFFRKGNLNDALYSITWPLSLQYNLQGNKAIITKINK